MDYENALALVHIGIMLTEYDPSLVSLPYNLIEVEQRIKNTFGVNLRQEADIQKARDKIVAVTEVLHEHQVH